MKDTMGICEYCGAATFPKPLLELLFEGEQPVVCALCQLAQPWNDEEAMRILAENKPNPPGEFVAWKAMPEEVHERLLAIRQGRAPKNVEIQ